MLHVFLQMCFVSFQLIMIIGLDFLQAPLSCIFFLFIDRTLTWCNFVFVILCFDYVSYDLFVDCAFTI